jgi:hypothetical protein
MFSTQLTDFHHLDTDNLFFQATEKENGVQRVRIMTHHMDGTRGDLIVSTPRFVTFGLQEIVNHTTKESIGYQLPFILWGKNGPTPEEELFISSLNSVTQKIKDFLLSYPDQFPNITEESLSKMDPIYYKTEKGERVENRAPVLFARLNSHKNGEETIIRTLFTDDHTKDRIDPLTILNKRCLVQGAIKIESVLIVPNARPRLQIKLFEVKVRPLNSGFKSLLEPGKIFPKNKKTTTQSLS